MICNNPSSPKTKLNHIHKQAIPAQEITAQVVQWFSTPETHIQSKQTPPQTEIPFSAASSITKQHILERMDRKSKSNTDFALKLNPGDLSSNLSLSEQFFFSGGGGRCLGSFRFWRIWK